MPHGFEKPFAKGRFWCCVAVALLHSLCGQAKKHNPKDGNFLKIFFQHKKSTSPDEPKRFFLTAVFGILHFFTFFA
jgi:hypothetical protein